MLSGSPFAESLFHFHFLVRDSSFFFSLFYPFCSISCYKVHTYIRMYIFCLKKYVRGLDQGFGAGFKSRDI